MTKTTATTTIAASNCSQGGWGVPTYGTPGDEKRGWQREWHETTTGMMTKQQWEWWQNDNGNDDKTTMGTTMEWRWKWWWNDNGNDHGNDNGNDDMDRMRMVGSGSNRRDCRGDGWTVGTTATGRGSGRGTHETGPNDVYRMERMKCTVVVTKIIYLALNTDWLVSH